MHTCDSSVCGPVLSVHSDLSADPVSLALLYIFQRQNEVLFIMRPLWLLLRYVRSTKGESLKK